MSLGRVEATLVRIHPSSRDVERGGRRSHRVEGESFVGGGSGFDPASEVELRLRGRREQGSAVCAGDAEAFGDPIALDRCRECLLGAADLIEQRREIRVAEGDPLDAAKLLGKAQRSPVDRDPAVGIPSDGLGPA